MRNLTKSQTVHDVYTQTKASLDLLGYKTHAKNLGFRVKLKPYKTDKYNMFACVGVKTVDECNPGLCSAPVHIELCALTESTRQDMKPSHDLINLIDSTEFMDVFRMYAGQFGSRNTNFFRNRIQSHGKASFTTVHITYQSFGNMRTHDSAIKGADLLLKTMRRSLLHFGFDGPASMFMTKESCTEIQTNKSKSIVIDGVEYLLTKKH